MRFCELGSQRKFHKEANINLQMTIYWRTAYSCKSQDSYELLVYYTYLDQAMLIHSEIYVLQDVKFPSSCRCQNLQSYHQVCLHVPIHVQPCPVQRVCCIHLHQIDSHWHNWRFPFASLWNFLVNASICKAITKSVCICPSMYNVPCCIHLHQIDSHWHNWRFTFASLWNFLVMPESPKLSTILFTYAHPCTTCPFAFICTRSKVTTQPAGGFQHLLYEKFDDWDTFLLI